MGTLKYISLFTTHRYTSSKCQLYYMIQDWPSSSLLLLMEGAPTSAPGLQPIIWLLSSPWSGDSLGLLYVIRVRLLITDSLTHIFSLPSTTSLSWPNSLFLLTVNLWRLANSSTRNSSNLISPFSMGDHVTEKIVMLIFQVLSCFEKQCLKFWLIIKLFWQHGSPWFSPHLSLLAIAFSNSCRWYQVSAQNLWM